MNRQKVILVCNNDEPTSHLITTTLELFYTLVIVQTANEALRVCQSILPNLVIVDEQFLGVIRHIRGKYPTVPLLVIGSTTLPLKWIGKPFKASELLNLVRGLVR